MFGVLLVFKVATLFGKGDEVGESHASEADVVDGINGAGLDVLGMVIIQSPLHSTLRVTHGEHRLEVSPHLFHSHALDLVVKVSHRHILPPMILLRSETLTLELKIFP